MTRALATVLLSCALLADACTGTETGNPEAPVHDAGQPPPPSDAGSHFDAGGTLDAGATQDAGIHPDPDAGSMADGAPPDAAQEDAGESDGGS
jgi:hypothetical protein